MRHLVLTLAVATTSACTTTHRSEVHETANTVEDRARGTGTAVKKGAQDVWSETEEAASEAYSKATTIPPEERTKRAFTVRHESRLNQLSAEVEGLKEQMEIFDVEANPRFKRALARYESARAAAVESLAGLRGSEVSDWRDRQSLVSVEMKRLDAAASALRTVVQSTAH